MAPPRTDDGEWSCNRTVSPGRIAPVRHQVLIRIFELDGSRVRRIRVTTS